MRPEHVQTVAFQASGSVQDGNFSRGPTTACEGDELVTSATSGCI